MKIECMTTCKTGMIEPAHLRLGCYVASRAGLNPRSSGGFTLIEAVMSMLIVGLMLVAALNTLGASKLSQSRNAEQVIGPALAEDLLTEILSQVYEEPDDTVEFGRESGESGGNRENWDDIDDYDDWSSSPPEDKSGDALPGLDGWGREVKVYWVDMTDLDQKVSSSVGLKRIDLKVTRNGRVITQVSALRTYAWPEP